MARVRISCYLCRWTRVEADPRGSDRPARGSCRVEGFVHDLDWFETKWAENLAIVCEYYDSLEP